MLARSATSGFCRLPVHRPAIGACPHKTVRVHRSRQMLTVAAALQPWHLFPAAGAVVGAAAAAVLDARLKSKKPDLFYTDTDFNQAVLSRCPTVYEEYKCTPGLTNGHVETILIAKLRRSPNLTYKREILRTEDGGAVAIDWEHFDLEDNVSISS